MSEIRLKRACEPADPTDGIRVLVDRLWPRGIKKSEAAIDVWLKDVAPSSALRQWFGHDPAKWNEFQKRYRAELSHNAALQELREVVAHNKRITLVFGARDPDHNNAVVLSEVCGKR